MAEPGKRHRVLIVEDEDNIAIALDYVLTREGYAHDRVSNGAEAMPRIRATRPDLVLLDVMLPEVSGYEICQQVRVDPDLSGFIAKPFELKELRAEVRRILAPEAGGSPGAASGGEDA
jgi:DNA-binding response OmpR family regulator